MSLTKLVRAVLLAASVAVIGATATPAFAQASAPAAEAAEIGRAHV